LPRVRNPSRLFFAVALLIAMTANAPAPRPMLFWLPGAFTYTLPACLTLFVFVLLYRALVDGTWISRRQFLLLIPGVVLASLCNELTGPITILILGLSVAARRSLAYAQPQARQHAVLIAAAFAGTLIVYGAPGNVVRADTLPGSGHLFAALFWGTLYV